MITKKTIFHFLFAILFLQMSVFSVFAQSTVTDIRVLINAGVTYTKIRSISLRIEANGATQMLIANDSTFRGAVWQKYVMFVPQFFLTEGEGEKIVYVKFKDSKNKESGIAFDKIILDKTPPQNTSIAIDTENGIVKDATKLVKIKLKADDAAYMMLSNTKEFLQARWEVFKPEIEWQLDAINDGSKDGLKQVFVRFRDKGGNMSEVFFDVVMVDTQQPIDEKITISTTKPFTTVADITLNLFVRGGTEMLLSEKPDFAESQWQPYQASLKWKLSTQGKSKIYAKFRDDAHNKSAVTSTEIIFDNLPPTDCLVEIDNGSEKTNHPDRVVKLKLVAKEAAQMLVSNSLDFFGCKWMPYSEIMMWKLATGNEGERTVYVRFKDEYGNETVVYSDSIRWR
jgi:hypothetical protein